MSLKWSLTQKVSSFDGFSFVFLQMTVIIDVFPAFMFFVSTHPKVPGCLTMDVFWNVFSIFCIFFFFFQSTAVVIETIADFGYPR